MNNEINMGSMHHALEGYYRVSVVDAETNEIIWEQPSFTKNLILNQGMDALVSFTYGNVFEWMVGGTGTRVNSIDSDTATVTQAGTAITLTPGGGFTSFTGSSGGYTNALSVGDTIVFDAGSGGVTYVQIASGVSNLTAVAKETATIPSTQFTIWKTSQVGLQTEVKRGGNNNPVGSVYVTGVGNCGTTWVSPVLQMRRTVDFAPESGTVYYTEIGTSWAAAVVNTNIFSRILLPASVQVNSGQKLRVSYELQLTFPNTPVTRSNVTITGWPVSPATNTNCTESIQWVVGTFNAGGYYNNAMISQVGYNGATVTYEGRTPALEPAAAGANCEFWISSNSSSIQAFGSAVDRYNPFSGIAKIADGGSTTVLSSYVAGSYTVNKTATFSIYQLNRTDIASMGFGQHDNFGLDGTYYDHQAFAVVFNQTQSKANTQTLTLAYTWTWARTYA